MVTALFILIGACFASFLNMLLWRLPREESIHGRSTCPKCGKSIAWYDLVPIISYLILAGKCRHCHKSISSRYFILEIISALIFGLYAYYLLPVLPIRENIIFCISLGLLISLLFFDAMYFILPDVITLPGIIIIGLYDIFYTKDPLTYWFTATALVLFFAILYAVSRGKWLGFGDVKLVGLIGLIFGYPMGYLVIVAAIWIGAALGLSMILVGTATRKNALPFGAFICAAAILAILFHNHLINLEYFFL